MNNINSNVGIGLIQLGCGVIFGNYQSYIYYYRQRDEYHQLQGVERQAFAGEQRAHNPRRDGGDAAAGKDLDLYLNLFKG